MEKISSRICSFTDLIAWQINYQLTIEIYKITKLFPKEEKFGIIDQIRRAASSIIANIAEGYGRYHYKDKLRFYYQARGSSMEVQNFLILSFGLGYMLKEDYEKLELLHFDGYKVLSGLIRKTESLSK